MSTNFTFSSPITGAAQTGFTSPTYTLAEDVNPNQNADQYAVTALGGTQDGVDVHSASNPFTLSRFVPKQIQLLPLPDVNGNYRQIPVNKYVMVTRKGVTLANGQRRVAYVRTECFIPAGADEDDPASIRAMCSAHIGALDGESAGFAQMLISGLR